jgi:hypothetical protein
MKETLPEKVTVRLTAKEYKALVHKADREHRNLPQCIRLIIEDWMRKEKP